MCQYRSFRSQCKMIQKDQEVLTPVGGDGEGGKEGRVGQKSLCSGKILAGPVDNLRAENVC